MFHGRSAVSEVGSRPRLPRPTRWNASSCIIETDGRDCDHSFARLRIDHLDYLGCCSFFTRFASVSSYDAACSWLCSFLACCWLCSFLVAHVHHPSLVDLRPVPAPGRSPLTSKSRLKFTAFCFISLSMDTNRHSRPSPSCHVSRAVSDPLITSDAKPPESDMWTS